MYVECVGDDSMAVSMQPSRFRRPIKTALHQAVLDGRTHQVRLLVSKHRVSVDSQDIFGRTPLMLACLLENEDYGRKMAKIFIRAGAYVNTMDNMERSALSYACLKGRVTIAKLLLQSDIVDINHPDNDGNTPLFHAALSGNPDMVRTMVALVEQYNMNIDKKNTMGYTPTLLACKYGHYVSAHIMLTQSNASPTVRDSEFYLNAQEWVLRSDEIQAALMTPRSRSAPDTFRFRRENTIYMTSLTPQCNHAKAPSHPLGQSLDTSLRLPAIFSHFSGDKPLEHVLNGAEAKYALLAVIDAALYNSKRPTSTTTISSPVSFTRARRSYPSTPKLLAMGRRSHTMMVPDIATIFRLYSDQCERRKTPPPPPARTPSRCTSQLADSSSVSMPPISENDGGLVSIREPTITVQTPSTAGAHRPGHVTVIAN